MTVRCGTAANRPWPGKRDRRSRETSCSRARRISIARKSRIGTDGGMRPCAPARFRTFPRSRCCAEPLRRKNALAADSAVARVVFREIVPGDLRKVEADAQDAGTGGGARDLRFRPYEKFAPVFSVLLPERVQEMRKRGGER